MSLWTRVVAGALSAALLTAASTAAQEEVQVDLPARVVLARTSQPVVVSFRQAVLGPGRVLRISVRAEGAPPGGRILFAAKNPRGGIGRSGRVGESEFVPVFESSPRASFGGVEISWSFESSGEIHRAGRRSLTLRWRIESVPVPSWMEMRGTAPGGGPPSGADTVPVTPGRERRERERPELRPREQSLDLVSPPAGRGNAGASRKQVSVQ